MEKAIHTIFKDNTEHDIWGEPAIKYSEVVSEIASLMAGFMRWLLFDQIQFEKTYGRMDIDKFYDKTIDDDEPIEYYSLEDIFQYWITNIKTK